MAQNRAAAPGQHPALNLTIVVDRDSWGNSGGRGVSGAVQTETAIPPRRFGLGDGLILMIALALSLERFRALKWFGSQLETIRWLWQGIGFYGGWGTWPSDVLTRQQLPTAMVARFTVELLRSLCPVLLGLTVAQPLLRLKRPRPPLWRVVRQPGLVICLLGVTLVGMLLFMGDWWFTGTALALPLTRGTMLLMLWPLLALPPWQAEASWVDRLGRVVGWGWIAVLIGGVVLEWLGWL
jgi:hypothetical protein